MAPPTITLETWAGNDISSANYRARFVGIEGRHRGHTAIIHRPTGWYPTIDRTEIDEQRVVILVEILTSSTDDRQNELARWFAPGTSGTLVVTVGSDTRALVGTITKIMPWTPGPDQFQAVLLMGDPRWRANSQTTTTQQCDTNPETWNVTPDADGVGDDKPVITITPVTTKAAANSWLYRRKVITANRVKRPLGTWALEVTGGGIDHATLEPTKSQTDGDDVRVRLNGVEIPRWAGEAASRTWNQATTYLWCNIPFSAGKQASLLAAATAGSPANGADLEVVDGGTAGWPRAGALLIDDECITYTGIVRKNSNGREAFTGITRGARNTTAASHSASATIYWVEHDIEIVYGHTGASAPDARNEQKPMLDLTSATLSNDRHEWLDMAHETDPRSMQWTRWREDRDDQSDKVLAPDGSPVASMQLEYQALGAKVGKPNFNTWRREVPCGTGASGGNVMTITRALDDTMGLTIYGLDVDGNELLVKRYQGALASGSDNVADPGSLARVDIYGFSQIVARRADGPPFTTAKGLTTTITDSAQQFTVGSAPIVVTACIVQLKSNAALGDVRFDIYADNGSDNLAADSIANVTLLSVPNTAQFHTLTFGSPVTLQANKKYWLAARYFTNAVFWYGGDVPYQGGKARVSAVLSSSEEYDFRLIGYAAPPAASLVRCDDNAVADDGDTAQITAVSALHLDTAARPYVSMRAEESSVTHLNGVLTNTTTGQTITLDIICKLNDAIEIDVGARRVRNVTTGVELPFGGTEYGGVVRFSDPDALFTLNGGANAMSYAEAGVVRTDVAVAFYSRWGA